MIEFLRNLLPRTRQDREDFAWLCLFATCPVALAWIFARWPVGVL